MNRRTRVTPGDITNTTGTLPVANGGTGITSYAVGDLLYASGTTTLSKLADVALGNHLVSGGIGAAPAWSPFPVAGATAGKFVISDGTNWIASTLIHPNSATAGQVVFASATNTYGASANLTFVAPSFSVKGANQITDNNAQNIRIMSTDAMAINKGGTLGLGGEYNTAGNLAFPFGQVSGRKENATDANAAGYLQFATSTSGGTVTERMRISSAGVVTIANLAGAGSRTVVADASGNLSAP